MEIKFYTDNDNIIELLSTIYPTGCIVLALYNPELAEKLCEKGYKVLSTLPYPEYARCIIGDDYQKIKEFNGIKILFPTIINSKMTLCDYLFFSFNSDKKLIANLYNGFVWEFLYIEDINLRHYLTFDKTFYSLSQDIKKVLLYNENSFVENISLFFEILKTIEIYAKKSNLINYIQKSDLLSCNDKFFIYFYILSAYFVFTTKGKFGIMSVKGRHKPLGQITYSYNSDYKYFKDIVENVKTSYDKDFLKTVALKYKKLNGKADFTVNPNHLKEILNTISDYTSESFYKELIENGFI